MSEPEENSTPSRLDSPVLNAVASHWWILLIRGVLLMLIGLYALFSPGLTLIAWAFVLGYFLIVDGILAIIAAIGGWAESRGWTIARGILGILAGAFVAGHPVLFGAIAAVTVVFVIAGWSIFGGVLEIVVAIKQRKVIEGEGWMILDGAVSILFGIVLAMAPLFSAAVLIRISGVFAILFGTVAIFTSFKLRKLKSS